MRGKRYYSLSESTSLKQIKNGSKGVVRKEGVAIEVSQSVVYGAALG